MASRRDALRSTGAGLLALLCLAGSARAQWSADPASNLALAQGAFSEVQPKLVATGDGGFYVSWYASDPAGSPAFGFDVRLQRIDAGGNEVWAPGGVLVADRGFSSTQDYDLDVDAAGNALLAFRDDRFTGTQITAAKVDPTGVLSWGTNGVQLTSTTSFVAAPKIAGTSDGNVVVAWTQDNATRVRKLDAAGTAAWGADVVLTPSGGGSFSASDMHASDAGGVVVAMQFAAGGFGSPLHLYAQKLDSDGNPLWGAAHLAVFDGGSLQFGNFPTFVPDGSGGAVFGWYSSSPSLECFAQRVLANGTEAFPHNGVAASTSGKRLRVSPSVAFDAAEQETFLFYAELNLAQSMSGVSAQKFDATGNRQWGPLGVFLVPLDAASSTDVVGVAHDDGASVFWAEAPSFGQDQIQGALLDDAGTTTAGPLDVSSTPASKFRLEAAASSLGFAAVVWQDDGSGTDDVAIQNLLPDGSLGGQASVAFRNGTGINPAGYTSLDLPRIDQTWTTQVDHGGAGTLTQTYVFLAGATGPVLFAGEVLVDLGGPPLFTTTVGSTGTADVHGVPIPSLLGLVGLPLATQALVVSGVSVQLQNALDPTIGL